MEHRGSTVLAMDCVLAGAEMQHGRPLNSIVRRHPTVPKRPAPQSKAELDAVAEGFFASLGEESDRGCVLVAAAFLDESLESLLRSKMLRDPKVKKACVEPLFATMGPLRSYWAKTQLAYALGYLLDWEYADLERIRELRNHFAHSYEKASFADSKVIATAKQLETAKRVFRSRPSRGDITEQSPRKLFTLSASNLAGRIHGLADLNREEAKG